MEAKQNWTWRLTLLRRTLSSVLKVSRRSGNISSTKRLSIIRKDSNTGRIGGDHQAKLSRDSTEATSICMTGRLGKPIKLIRNLSPNTIAFRDILSLAKLVRQRLRQLCLKFRSPNLLKKTVRISTTSSKGQTASRAKWKGLTQLPMSSKEYWHKLTTMKLLKIIWKTLNSQKKPCCRRSLAKPIN